jgi:hypothetical protein
MKNLLLIAFVFFTFVGCNDDNSPPDSKLFMTFDPRFDGDDMQMGDVNTNVHNYPFTVSGMRFYVSNIVLHREDGGRVELSEIEFVDIAQNKRSLEFQIPNGRYSGISYDLGVPPVLNGIDEEDFSIAQYGADHPLNSSNGMHWTMQLGYRFFVFEGRYDTVPNSGDILPHPYAFHTGLDTLYREVGFFPKSYNADGGRSLFYSFYVDVDSIFSTSAGELDLALEDSFHGAEEQLRTGIKAANNMAKSFVLK